MDKQLLADYQAAVQARAIVDRLPPGLRSYAKQYEQICLEDLRAQSGRPELSEEEVMAGAKPHWWSILLDLWPIISPLVIDAIKKRWPTIAASGVTGAIITYLTK